MKAIAFTCLLMLLGISMCAIAGDAGFERYKVILERRPFGKPPPEPPKPVDSSPVGSQMPKPPPFIKDISLFAFTRSDGGTVKVGFMDKAAQPHPKHYHLAVGQKKDGFLIVKASYKNETATIRKGGEEFEIGMDGAVSREGAAGVEIARPGGQQAKVSRKRLPVPSGPVMSKEEYRKLLAEGKVGGPWRARSAAMRGIVDPLEGATREERDAALRQYNLDLIRAGGEGGLPLPIELTPEEDAQLVEEGILPPPP